MVEKTSNWEDSKFDTIIDVRAPLEFFNDHIIGAVNCPVFNDNERAEVGCLYKKASAFEARVKGASIAARNIALHVETQFSRFDGSWRPLVYCWRGGQRSRAMSLVLQEIGWRVAQLEGGHKKYREDVVKLIPQLSKKFHLVLLSGQTGSAKTQLLNEIALAGAQVLDLEGLANHRGSLLGAIPETPQPSQKYFESLLLDKLMKFSENSAIFIESESSKIGNLHIPSGLWNAMCAAPCIELHVPAKVRAAFLTSHYTDLRNDPNRLRLMFSRAKSRINPKIIHRWNDFLEQKSWNALALSLIEDYYDPAYLVHRKRKNRIKIADLNSENLTDAHIKALAQKMLELVKNSVQL